MEIGDTKICARDVNDRIDACQGRITSVCGNIMREICSSGDSGGPMVIDERGPDGECELFAKLEINHFYPDFPP